MAGYPYNAGDRVMVGICTWQSPRGKVPPGRIDEWPSPLPREYRQPEGPSGPFCRYFVPATVKANDRQDGLLVVEMDRPHAGGHGWDVLDWESFDGEEVVPYDETLPQAPADAQRRALAGEVF